jgi:hypothetical protein
MKPTDKKMIRETIVPTSIAANALETTLTVLGNVLSLKLLIAEEI